MLLPLSDVPRWYAERKPHGTIAVRHGQDTLTWDELERGANRRARAFMAKGVKPGDFVAIGLPNGNAFFETSFAVWKCGRRRPRCHGGCRAARPLRCSIS